MGIEDKKAKAIGEALKANTSLTKLDLSFTNITIRIKSIYKTCYSWVIKLKMKE